MAGSTALIVGREINRDAIATAQASGHHRVECDVMNAPPHRKIDGYIASPPCQTFSTAGKGEGRKHLGSLKEAALLVAKGMHPKEAVWQVADEALDERSILLLHPLRVIRESQPEWVAMEQVPNALPVFEVIAECMRELGYIVRTEVLYAEEYGVPQTRKRAILVGVKSEHATEVPWPTKTHSRYHVRTPERLDEGYPRWVSMAEALTWAQTDMIGFPRKADSDDIVTIGGTDYRARDLREAAEPAFAVSGKTRSWKRYMGDVIRSKGTIREIGQPAPTITGSMDNGNTRWMPEFNDQSGTPFDPDWPSKRPATAVAGRGLVQNPGATANRHNGSTKSRNDGVKVTVDEAAVLQSFPVDYPWQGTMTSKFQRVGDAVPPLLAAAILSPILALFAALDAEAAA